MCDENMMCVMECIFSIVNNIADVYITDMYVGADVDGDSDMGTVIDVSEGSDPT